MSRSKFARPYILRLISLSRFTWPSTGPVLLALNNSALYLGIAVGAAVGGPALRTLVVTQLAFLGGISILLALLIVAVTLCPSSAKPPQTDEKGERERDSENVFV